MQEKNRGKFPWQRLVFIFALLICTVMTVMPGSIDPTSFLNDKVKHVIVFFILALMLDGLAFPTVRFTWYKPMGQGKIMKAIDFSSAQPSSAH